MQAFVAIELSTETEWQ